MEGVLEFYPRFRPWPLSLVLPAALPAHVSWCIVANGDDEDRWVGPGAPLWGVWGLRRGCARDLLERGIGAREPPPAAEGPPWRVPLPRRAGWAAGPQARRRPPALPAAAATCSVMSVTETLHNLPKPPYALRALAATALSTAALTVANL